jgi:hypothetical protein
MASTTGDSFVRVKTPLQFDSDKAINAILFVAKRLGGNAADLYCALKTAYFADRIHLSRYGRFIFGDTYRRIEYGPVPRNLFAMIGHLRKGKGWASGKPKAEGFLKVGGTKKKPTIIALVEPDLDWFSESDLECLNEAIEECRLLTFDQLKEKGHDDPACQGTPLNQVMTIERIASTLPDSGAVLQYLHDQCPG